MKPTYSFSNKTTSILLWKGFKQNILIFICINVELQMKKIHFSCCSGSSVCGGGVKFSPKSVWFMGNRLNIIYNDLLETNLAHQMYKMSK